MQFEKPLTRWNFARREKRFFIYGEDSGQVAHCANTGSMKTLLEHAVFVWVRDYGTDTKRTLRYGAEILELRDGTLAVINTAHANTLAGEALRKGLMTHLGPLQNLQAEVKYSSETRFDWAAETASGQRLWIEVKNVTMGTNGVAQFPDAVTERGTKHLNTLTEIVKNGAHALQIYMATRTDAQSFSPAAHIDATYAQALKTAVAAGVHVVALGCKISPQGIEVCQTLPIML